MRHELMLENRSLSDINPLICGAEACEAGHRYGPAVRRYILLHYVHKGGGALENERGRFTVRAGQIFVIRPDEVTVYTADARSPWVYTWVGFESGLDLTGVLTADVLEAAGCGALFTEMARSEQRAGLEWYICGKIYEVLHLLAQPREETGGPRRYVRLALDFIEANYMQEMTVESLAKNLGLDRSYFSRLFTQETGLSPQAYLVDFRLKKAAELLAVYGLRPGQAASQVGYADVAHFSRMFTRRYGTPPGHYRQAAQNGAAE